MLRILGSQRGLCDGLSRRDLLQVGGATTLGLGLAPLLQQQATASNTSQHLPGFGRAKQCLLLYLYGAASQLETFDMKPGAPLEIRGPLQPIHSTLPGLDVCELLPETARVMDRVAVVRSVTHPYPVHGVAYATTGIPVIDIPMELSPHDNRHHPYFGSLVQYLDQRRGAGIPADLPQNVALPFPFSSQRVGEVSRAGPYAAFLGSAYNPTWTEFRGAATHSVKKTLRDDRIDCFDPYLGCTSDSHFRFAATESLPEMTLSRMQRRRSLLQQWGEQRTHWDADASTQALSKYQQLAFSLITSSRAAEALDVRREDSRTRELYGQTLFGQACLAGRRMLEAGTRLVSVFWDEYGLAGDAWDTHYNHLPRMKEQLLPQFDRAFSGLILDLDQRGLLDDTLVAVLTEHGRTPKLASIPGGGRDHWSQAYSLVLAGGGIARGKVVGATDKHAGSPTERPVSPKDVLATMYHLLGINPHERLTDRIGQTVTPVPEGAQVIRELLA